MHSHWEGALLLRKKLHSVLMPFARSIASGSAHFYDGAQPPALGLAPNSTKDTHLEPDKGFHPLTHH